MANNKKISELTQNPAIDGTEEIALEKSGANFKNTFTQLKDWVLTFVTTGFIQTARPLKTVGNESLEGTGDIPIPSSGVQSVTGDGVGGTATNPVLTFPTPTEINLGNVDNTSDVNKPISTATQTALDLKGNQTEVDLNTAKVGITPTQASDITTNNAKVSDINHVTIELPNVDNTSDLLKPISNDTQTALDLKVAIATNPSKTVKAAIKAFYDATTSTLEISIDGTDIT